MRHIAFLERQAGQHGATIGRFGHQVLEGPLPWTRMRLVYAPLALVRRYGESGLSRRLRMCPSKPALLERNHQEPRVFPHSR